MPGWTEIGAQNVKLARSKMDLSYCVHRQKKRNPTGQNSIDAVD
jgi:hypothetical protein